MASINSFRRWIRKSFAVLRARPLLRDADLPSLKDIFDGRINRRTRKLLKENKLTFNDLFQKSIGAKEEFDSILSHELNPLEYNLDFGPDQLLVGIKNTKIDFILVDI